MFDPWHGHDTFTPVKGFVLADRKVSMCIVRHSTRKQQTMLGVFHSRRTRTRRPSEKVMENRKQKILTTPVTKGRSQKAKLSNLTQTHPRVYQPVVDGPWHVMSTMPTFSNKLDAETFAAEFDKLSKSATTFTSAPVEELDEFVEQLSTDPTVISELDDMESVASLFEGCLSNCTDTIANDESDTGFYIPPEQEVAVCPTVMKPGKTVERYEILNSFNDLNLQVARNNDKINLYCNENLNFFLHDGTRPPALSFVVGEGYGLNFRFRPVGRRSLRWRRRALPAVPSQ